MRRGNRLIVLPFIVMLLFASCQQMQFGFGSEYQPIPAEVTHDDGIRTEYHDFSTFGNG